MGCGIMFSQEQVVSLPQQANAAAKVWSAIAVFVRVVFVGSLISIPFEMFFFLKKMAIVLCAEFNIHEENHSSRPTSQWCSSAAGARAARCCWVAVSRVVSSASWFVAVPGLPSEIWGFGQAQHSFGASGTCYGWFPGSHSLGFVFHDLRYVFT